MRFFIIFMVSLFLTSCGDAEQAAPNSATVYIGGTIYTGGDDGATAEAVVVFENRITFVGSKEDALEFMGEGGEIVDLEGVFMFPGFTDAHAHLLGIGHRELTLNLAGSTSIEDVQHRLRAYMASFPSGQNVIGRGWIETHWPEARFLTRHDIDAVVADRPVMLGRSDGHAVTFNTAALEMLEITKETPVPEGGAILRDEKGELTGVLVDAAKEGPEARFFEALIQRRDEGYEASSDFLTSHGWTQIHNMGDPYDDVAVIEGLSDGGRIKVRVYNSMQGYFPGIGPNPAVYELLENGARESQNGLVTTRSIKLYLDGALGSRGAVLLEPYADANTKGLPLADRDVYMDVMEKALKGGLQVNTHAIGDGGNRQLLDWYAEAFTAVPPEDRAIADPRWRDEHTQILDPDDIPRFVELGVIPSMQPSHAIGDLYFAPDRLGLARLQGAYAWQALIDSGSIIAGGSDAPVERGDPRIEFYAAVARKSMDGYSGEGWHPEQAVSRADALKMFTIWPAYAAFQENDLGTIEVGKLADFTVFSGDIMTIPEADILGVEVVMTVVDGIIVYHKP